MDVEGMARASRSLRDALEPTIGSVYFSPECHVEYAQLGFEPSIGDADGVELPDGAAYFCSRGSALGQAPGTVVAAAFGVFNPSAVVPMVSRGWTLTNAGQIAAARDRGALAQLRRILGEPPEAMWASRVLLRGVDAAHSAGRPLYSGLLARGLPGDPLGDLWRAGDLLRELRGDAHNAAWTTAGLTPIEIGLLTELWWGLPARTYVRTRAWTDEQLDAGQDGLRSRGLLDGDELSELGHDVRERVEVATDRQMVPSLAAIGDDLDDLLVLLRRWSAAVVDAKGYLSGPSDLTDR
ncbi:MAG: hypothetical protein AAFZ07_13290 [Actinomycetota bacterium]